MNNVFVWVAYLCFVIAGIQVIRLLKLHYEEKERSEKEAKKLAQEAKRLEVKIKHLEEEAQKKRVAEQKQRYIQKQKEQQMRKKNSHHKNRSVQQNKGKYDKKNNPKGCKKPEGVPELWGVAGIYANTYVTLKQEILFGRDYSCNLVFPAEMPRISRKHCMLKFDKQKGMFCLTDLRSSYGTFLGNGKQLQPGESVWISVNDEFYLGSGERFRVGLRVGE